MFFIASKIFYFLITPLFWIFGLMILALIKKNQRKLYLVISFCFLVIFTSPLLINQVMNSWESAPLAKDAIPLVSGAVVLGGILNQDLTPEDQTHFHESVDRITEALVLAQQGLVGEIIISGGSASVLDQSKKESSRIKEFIQDLYKYPPNLTLDTISRNTYENAIEVARILEERNRKDQPILLITSAFHMKRAMLCFKKQGIKAIPYPVDYKSKSLDRNPAWLLPSSAGLSSWELLIKEWVGIAVYKIFGYI